MLVGRDAEGSVVRATGTVGHAGFEKTTWKGFSDRGGWINTIGTRGEAAIAFQKSYGYGILGLAVSRYMPSAVVQTYPESRLWRLGRHAPSEAGRSLLDVTCLDDLMEDDGVLCTAFDGAQTRIVAVDPATAAVTPLGMLEGPFYADHSGVRGWLAGWWRGRPAAVLLRTRVAIRPPRDEQGYVERIAPAETVIGTVTSVQDGTRVRLYPLPAQTGTLTRAE